MPHMANLPWNLSYLFIFVCIFLMISKIYFNFELKPPHKASVANSVMFRNNKSTWKW